MADSKIFDNTETPDLAFWKRVESNVGKSSAKIEQIIKADREPLRKVDDGFIPFLKSTVSALGPETIGIRPSPEVQQYRDENPYAGFASEALGIGIPVAASMGAASYLQFPRLAARLPALGRVVRLGERLAQAERPFLAGAVRESVLLAPYEAARIAGGVGAEASGHEGAGLRALSGAALDFAGTAAFGTVLEGFRQFRPFASTLKKIASPGARIAKEIPEYNFEALPQERLAQLESMVVPEGPLSDRRANLVFDIEQETNAAREEVLRAVPDTYKAPAPRGNGSRKIEDTYIDDIEGMRSGSSRALLSRMFKPHVERGVYATRFLVQGIRNGFKNEEAYSAFRAFFDSRPGWEQRTMFPRAIEVQNDEVFEAGLRETLGTPVEDGLYISREYRVNPSQTKSYVVARRLPREGDERARWALFKTNDPGFFFPAHDSSARLLASNAFKIRKFNKEDALRAMAKPLAYFDEELKASPPPGPDNTVPNRPRGRVREAMERMLPQEIEAARRDLGDMFAHLGRVAKEYIAPLTHQFSDAPRLNWAVQTAARYYEKMEIDVLAMHYGERLASKGGSAFRTLFGMPKYSKGIFQEIDEVAALGQEHWVSFIAAMRSGASVGELVKENLHPRVMQAITFFDKIDGDKTEALDSVMNYYGIDLGPFNSMRKSGHRMFSHVWNGSFRAEVALPDGTIIGYGSGTFPKHARDQANRIIERLEELRASEGLQPSNARIVRDFNSTFKDDLDLMSGIAHETQDARRFRRAQVMAYRPKTLDRRTGVAGWVGDLDIPTPAKFKDLILSNNVEGYKYISSLVLAKEIEPMVREFARYEGRNLAAQAIDRINRMGGSKGKFSAILERGVDKFLAPFIGTNGAERVVRTMNRVQYGLTLGFLDIGYPIVNTTSIFTQLLPELQFVQGAPPGTLGFYDVSIVKALDGTMRDVSYVNPGKLLWRAVKELWNPSDEFREAFERGVKGKDVAPRFLEEVVGHDVELSAKLLAAAKGDPTVSLTQSLLALNELPGAKSEELARAVAFSSGWLLGKHYGLSNELSYRLAAQLTRKSMFGYSTAERALLTTGALGKSFGLFKTYSISYVANMMQYFGAGITRGQWAPFMWMMGSTSAVAGAVGTPLYAIAKGLYSVLTDDDLTTDMYKLFTLDEDEPNEGLRMLGNVFMDGFPAVAGITFQNRAQSPLSNPIYDFGMFTNMMLLDRMASFTRGISATLDHYSATGDRLSPITSRAARDAWLTTFAPRTVQRAMMWSEDRAIRSLRTGNKLVGGVNELEGLLHTIGIQPLDIARAYELDEITRNSLDRMAAKVTSFGTAYAMARTVQERNEILARAFKENVNVRSVVMSAHMKERNMDIERSERVRKTNEQLILNRMFRQ
jgi:hypothetical protein